MSNEAVSRSEVEGVNVVAGGVYKGVTVVAAWIVGEVIVAPASESGGGGAELGSLKASVELSWIPSPMDSISI